MKFYIFNFSVTGGKTDETYFDDVIMKEAAFSSKYGVKGRSMHYTYCLVPHVDIPEKQSTDYHVESYFISDKSNIILDQSKLYSLYMFLKNDREKSIGQLSFSIDFIRELDDTQMNITYTDGSFKKDTSTASYACFQLTEELNQTNYNNPAALDDFTHKTFCYNKYSGTIDNGTNNIGELTGIKTACDVFGDRAFQLIISDSEYSIKAYREWIYNWKENGYKTYAKKPIANRELIEATHNNLTSCEKIVFYKWTKGHANNSFNELCDVEAKSVLGI